jgi:large subunit ribosomal protein L22
MRGPKLNEGATVATMESGERHGTKATAKYVRSSAYKARVVLDLIRGLDVQRADQVLQFTERGIAHDIRKVLASAVANASNPDNTGAYIADPDELFVLACFADEGPTLRRFRPRARGRATRIRKRTCHITIVVARMSDDRLEVVRARIDGNTAGASANRRARVERSRKRAEAAKAGVDAVEADEAIEDLDDETADDIVATDDTDVEGFADVEEADIDEASTTDESETDEGSASDESDGGSSGSEADASPDHQDGSASDESDGGSSGSEADASPDHEDGAFAPAEYAGAVLPDADGNGPDTHPIKGNADSMLYHTPDSRYYKVTKAEVWFDTEENAEAAGFAKPGTATPTDKDED